MSYPKSRRTPFSDAEVRQLGGYLTDMPHLYDEVAHRLYARLVRTENRLDEAQRGAEEETHAYNSLCADLRAEIAKVDAVRALVREAIDRMEPVSWVDALTSIVGTGDQDGGDRDASS
jgi:hypothetical protein